MPLSIYVHLPFCRKKCPYCNFTSGFKPERNSIETYISALCGEIALFKKFYGNRGIAGSVYIGGGTPSLLAGSQINTIFDKIKSEFVISRNENTIEANPEDISPDLAEGWKSAGINRVSLGFQSMEEKVLRFLGRKNDPDINLRAVNTLRDKGFSNISLDWIACIRGEHTVKTLESFLALKPPHISVYQLTIEDKTLLKINVSAGKYLPLKDFTAISHYREIRSALLGAGYKHYEISNFALEERYFSSHNLNYWNYGEYIGLGAGASGYLRTGPGPGEGIRWTNTCSLKDYSARIASGSLPRDQIEQISRETAIREFIMLGLRKTSGITYSHYEELFHDSIENTLISKLPPGLRRFLIINDKGFSLTERGFEVSDRIIRELWGFISF